MIELKNLTKEFPNVSGASSHKVLHDINLTINKGEILGIIGRSGAGKSTLVRCMNLLEQPTSGEVFIQGQNLAKLSQKELRQIQQKIPMVFQNFNLLWNRSIYQNLQLPLEISNIPKKEWKKRINTALEMVELQDHTQRYPSQLSGGQKQRVGIARALVLQPEAILCDEITSALDPETTDTILELLKKIHQQAKITIILITHEMDVIQKICQRAIVLHQGNIVEEGKVFDLFSSPKHTTTRRFIRNIYQHDLPDDIAQSIENHPRSEHQLLRLIYEDHQVNSSTLSKMIQSKGVDVNILHGRIEYVQGKLLGLLWVDVKLNGYPRKDIIEYLENTSITVEVIDHAQSL